MVGSTGIGLRNEGVNLSPSVKHLLQYGGLVDVKGRSVDITQDGFAFVLQEVNAQVWTILVLYLENSEQVRSKIHVVLFHSSPLCESLTLRSVARYGSC